jgi:hypothetical protein
MKNSKGQVLVTFVIIIPVILMILALVVDVGLLYIEKRQTDSTVREMISYGLDNITLNKGVLEDRLIKLANANLDDIKKIDITTDNSDIRITLEKDKNSLFSNIYKKAKYQIISAYVGEIKNNRKYVRRKL